MTHINLSMKQTHRHGEQTCGYQRGKQGVGWGRREDKSRDWD